MICGKTDSAMWTCRATSAEDGLPLDEAVFLSPDGKVYRSHAAETSGFEKLEVYFRQLGNGSHREPGWEIRVPERYKDLVGWFDSEGERRLNYLEVFDPMGRRTLLEFLDKPGEDLYHQLLSELADEFAERRDDGQERQLRPRPVPEGNGADRSGRQPVAHQDLQQTGRPPFARQAGQEHRLQRSEDGGRKFLQKYVLR